MFEEKIKVLEKKAKLLIENLSNIFTKNSSVYISENEYGIRKYKTDISSANLVIKKLSESLNLADKTVNPEIFFKRLHFSLDCALELMTYKNDIFKGTTPEEQYKKLLEEIETRVNMFIERSFIDVTEKTKQLKTEKGKLNRLMNYFANMETAFNNSHNYWEGSSNTPHYNGILYTDNNIQKLHDLKEKSMNICMEKNI